MMKRNLIFYVLLSMTFIILVFISSEKIVENKNLNLNMNYIIAKYNGYDNTREAEYLLLGPQYTIDYIEKGEKNEEILDYYGDIEKLGRINNFWIGKLKKYEEIEEKDYISQEHFYLVINGNEKLENFLKNNEGYFIIGENIEKFNLTYQEMKLYAKKTKINLENPNQVIQKYGNNQDFTPKYLKKESYFISKGYNFNYKELLKKFKNRKNRIICVTVLILLLEIVFYKKLLKKENYKRND